MKDVVVGKRRTQYNNTVKVIRSNGPSDVW